MHIKRNLSMMLIILLTFVSLPLTALANDEEGRSDHTPHPGSFAVKDEVIYGNLGANGKIKNMYVVNYFDITESGEIVDYGNYTDVRNLTDLSTIEQADDNKVLFQAESDEFYYQGELEGKPLPWDISITYLLDGKEVNPDELAGQSGDFEVKIETAANKDVDSLFFENYLLQISLTLDPLIFNDIQAPKGTEANEGKNKQMTFSVMPDQEDVFILSANVDNFKLDPISISAVPANIAIEDPDIGHMTDDMQTLANAINDIHSGVSEFKNGIAELNEGTSKLNNGSTEFKKGIVTLDESSGELVNGSKQMLATLEQVSNAMQKSPEMPDVTDIEALPGEFRRFSKEMEALSEGISHLEDAIKSIPNNSVSGEQLEQLYVVLKENEVGTSVIETVNELENAYLAAQTIKKMSESIPDDLAEITTNMAKQMKIIADEMEANMGNLEQLDDLTLLQDGLVTLASEYKTFHAGLVTYTEGVHSLATSYETLDAGIQDLSTGTVDLKKGVNELLEGTAELKQSTSDLPSEMKSEIEEFMEEYDYSDFEPISFISEKNKNIQVVQFVLQTEKIEKEEEETIVEEEEIKEGLWDRFINLFK